MSRGLNRDEIKLIAMGDHALKSHCHCLYGGREPFFMNCLWISDILPPSPCAISSWKDGAIPIPRKEICAPASAVLPCCRRSLSALPWQREADCRIPI